METIIQMRNRNLVRLIAGSLGAFALLFMVTCTSINNPVAGGSEIRNPIVATIMGPEGKPAPDVPVAIVPVDYNPLKQGNSLSKTSALTLVNLSIIRDTSDVNGQITINPGDSGMYNLVAASEQYQYDLFVPNIRVSTIKDTSLSRRDTINLGTIFLRRPGTVLLNVDSSHFSAGMAFIVPGSFIAVPVANPGVTAMAAPCTIVTIRTVTKAGDSVAGGPLIVNIEIPSGSIIDRTNIPDSISVPLKPTGPHTGQVTVSYTFAATGAKSNKGFAVQYRFDWGDGAFSAWVDSTASHAWPTPGTYHIKAVARKTLDTTVLSSWSDTLSITMEPHTITTPGRPVSLDSLIAANSPLSFTTGNATSSLGHAIQYRYNWGDTVISAWSSSSNASHSWTGAGTFPVIAQARSASDTGAVSAWSPAKSVNVVAAHTITTPSRPTATDSVIVKNTPLTFTTGGAMSNLGQSIKYCFNWGNGQISAWTSSLSAQYTWPDTGVSGIFQVTAQARGSIDTNSLSSFSPSKTIRVVNAHVVSAPQAPTGPDSILAGNPYKYQTGGAGSNLLDSVQYRFVYSKDSSTYFTTWSSQSEANITWSTAGTYTLYAQARSTRNTAVLSNSGTIKRFIR